MRDIIPDVRAIADDAHEVLTAKNKAREAALSRCRDATRHAANAVRAVHREDYEAAEMLIERAGQLLDESREALREHLDVFYAGFLHDAEKEYVEARSTLAIISGRGGLPGFEALGVQVAAYLNGLGEAVGELRRYLLDRLRLGDLERCEACLAVMDEIYGVLITFDYPDAMTGGLRRTTDNVRGILERTRGDFVLAATQRQLEDRMRAFEERLPG